MAKQESASSQSKAASSSRLKTRNKHREPHLGSDSSLQIEEDDLDESLEDEDEICLSEDLPPSSAPTGTSFAGPSQESSGMSQGLSELIRNITISQRLEAPKSLRKRNLELRDENPGRWTLTTTTTSISRLMTSLMRLNRVKKPNHIPIGHPNHPVVAP